VMSWQPETPDEVRAANVFYDAAHGLGLFAKPVAKGKPLHRSPEEAALIAGILANRAEDTGYLVYADYLTERGNSHGDFIRLAVQMGRLEPGSRALAEADELGGDLVADRAEEWFAPLGELGLRPEVQGTFAPWWWLSFERGVIDRVSIDRPGVLPENAERLFAAAPFLRKLEFERGHFRGAALAKVKQLAQIEELDLGACDATADDVRALLRSKHLTGLRALTLGGNPIGDEGVRHLCAWSHLARLEELNVASCDITPAGFERLGACERLAGLKRLKVGHNVVAGEGALPLLCSPHLTALEELEFGNLNIDPLAAVGFGAFPKLRALDLSSVAFEGTGFAVLTTHTFPALEVLKLDSTRLTPGNMEALAGAPCAARLRELHLDNVDTGIAGLAALAYGRFTKLETLVLSRNRLGARGAAVLGLSAKQFPALTHLNLWDCNITPDGVADLVRYKLTAHLTALDLSSNNIGPAGAEALASARHLKRLKKLIVDERSVGKKGRAALLARFGESVMDFR
jgi:uncharacterized protein (TIGR02996 family)